MEKKYGKASGGELLHWIKKRTKCIAVTDFFFDVKWVSMIILITEKLFACLQNLLVESRITAIASFAQQVLYWGHAVCISCSVPQLTNSCPGTSVQQLSKPVCVLHKYVYSDDLPELRIVHADPCSLTFTPNCSRFIFFGSFLYSVSVPGQWARACDGFCLYLGQSSFSLPLLHMLYTSPAQ